MRRTPFLVLVAFATLVVAIAAPVSAHTGPPAPIAFTAPSLTETLTSAAPGPATPWTAIVLLGAVGLAAAWRPRRAIAVALVLVVGILAFEAGMHSAHHLGQPDDGARCVVAWMSGHLSADVVDTALDALLAPVPEAHVPTLATPVVAARLVAPDAGRAPPVLSA
jgi:hypothetical protein